jgi:hypothetical protein
MDYTFALFYKAADAKHRGKSAVVFSGASLGDIMLKVNTFKQQYPEYIIGAGVEGIHSSVP